MAFSGNEANKAAAKRVFDCLLTILLLVLMAPFLLLLIILILAEQLWAGDGITLFLFEPRLSRGEAFNLIKLNMYRESSRKKYIEEDDRYSKTGTYAYLQGDSASLSLAGRLIKKYYLDEVGQFFNILLGDMSLVGPRPHPPNFASNLLPPRQQQKAGLVGFYATRWKNGKKAVPEEADMEYLLAYERSSVSGLVLMDAVVLLDAVKAVLRGKGL